MILKHQLMSQMITKNDLIEDLIAKAEILINNNQIIDARKILLEILTIHDSENLDAANNFAVTEILLGNFDEAENLIYQILKKDPLNEIAQSNFKVLQDIKESSTTKKRSNLSDNERIILKPDFLSYQRAIFNKVYPHFDVKELLKEVRSIIHQLCYSSVWNSLPESISEWRDQKIPLQRFEWLYNNSLILAPETHHSLKEIFQENKLTLSLTETADIIISAANEIRKVATECSKSIEISRIESNKSFENWYSELNSRQEKWLLDEYINDIKANAPQGLDAVLLHGSLSDGRTVTGYSDFDVNYVISIPDNPEKLIELMEWILQSNRYLLSYNPFMHHGPILVLKEELLVCSESVFPSTLIHNGIWLHNKIEYIHYVEKDFENLYAFHSFYDFFNNNFNNVDEFKNIFDVIWWTSSVFMLPLFYNQMITGKSSWKRVVLDTRANIPEQYWKFFDELTEVRNQTGNYLREKIELPLPLIDKNLNPGTILKENKQNFALKSEEILSLGITNDLLSLAKQYFDFCSMESFRMNELNFNESGFSYKDVSKHWMQELCEIPEKADLSDYIEVREEFIRRCSANSNVISVFEFGNIGCPGLSDLDFLVILSDDCKNVPQELTITNMSPKHAEIMNHDPLFVEESSVDFLGAVFPLFNAQLIYGRPLKLKMSAEFNDTVLLSLFTFMNVLKYPKDIIYLCGQERIRWKTLLAYLNSFNHIVKAFEYLKIIVPQSIQNCVTLNREIRNKFNSSIVELKDLNDAVDLMIEASADTILEFEKLWAGYLPETKEMYQLTDRNEFVKNIQRSFSSKGKEKFELPDIINIVMLHLQKTDDCIKINSELFKRFTALFDEYLTIKNKFINSELQRGRAPNYYITGQKFSTLVTKESLGLCSLARLDQIESSQFKWFMFKLNLFAYENSLRPMLNWSKVWEYPWIWFNVFHNVDLKGKVVVDLGSELSPVPWVIALNGAKVVLIETDSSFVPVWEKVNEKYNLNVEWKIVNDEIIPLPDGYADIITSFSVIEHQPDKLKAVNEVLRVLKNKGVFGLSFDICEYEMGMTFPEWNGKALTIDDFEKIIWNNPSFKNNYPPHWNLHDIDKFWNWHLKSAEHHNYVTAAAVLTNHKVQQIDYDARVGRDGNNKPAINVSSVTPLILNKSEIKNIIWLRTDSIGDNILASSMLKYIKAQFPDSSITVICQDHITELYEYCPYINGVIGFDKSKMVSDSNYQNSIFTKINFLNPDLFLNTIYSCEMLTHEFALSSKAPIRIGINGDTANITNEERDKANLYYTHLVNLRSDNQVEIKRHEEFLKSINIEFNELKPEVWLSEEDLKWSNQIFKDNDTEEGIVVFAGTQHSIKNYESLGKAINDLPDKGDYTFFVLGDANNEDINNVNINDLDANVVNLTGCTSIRQAMALISKCKLSVGVDTSLAHAACALDVPNVIVLGGGHFGRFLPYSSKTSVVCRPMNCFGCNWDCIYEKAHCITNIDHKLIIIAIEEALKNPKQKPTAYFGDHQIPLKVFADSLDGKINLSDISLIFVEKDGRLSEFIYTKSDNKSGEGESNCLSCKPINLEEKITVITTIAPFDIEKQKAAVESWLNAGFSVISLNCSKEKKILERLFPDVRFIAAERDAKAKAGKPYVYFDDMMRCLGKYGSQVCGIINSDILLNVTPGFISEIKNLAADSLIYGSRVDVEKLDSNAGSFYEFGYDFFFFNKSLINIYPESEFCLGLPWWDYWMVAVPLSKKIKLKKVISPIAVHLWHPTNYNNEYWLNLGKSFVELLENQHLIKINKTSYSTENIEENNSHTSYELFIELNKNAEKTKVSCINKNIAVYPKDFIENRTTPKEFLMSFFGQADAFKQHGSKNEMQFAEDIEQLVDIGLFEEAYIKIWEYLKRNQESKLAIHFSIIFNFMKNDFNRAAYIIKYMLEKELSDHTSLNILQYFKNNCNIKVSAIVSVYNSGKFIKGCLEDLTSQTLFKKNQLEIVIVNCGSDKTDERVIEKYKSRYLNIAYIKVDKRISIYKAWNIGIKAASGIYITNANTDDRHKNDAFEKMLNVFQSNDNIDIIYADCYQTEIPNSRYDQGTNLKIIRWADFDKDLLLFGCFIGPQPMWKKSLHNKYGYFDESLEVVGDYEFWLRISEAANFFHINEVLGLYYFSSSSAEHRNKILTDSENLSVQKKYISRYVKSQSDIDRILRKVLIMCGGFTEHDYYRLVYNLLKPKMEEISFNTEYENIHSKNFSSLLSELNELISLKKYDESIGKALSYLDEIKANKNDFSKENKEVLYQLLGNLFLLKNDINNAQHYFAEELKINPESSMACLGLAQSFAASEMYNEAKTMFEWAVHHNSKNTAAINGLIRVNELLGLQCDNYSLATAGM